MKPHHHHSSFAFVHKHLAWAMLGVFLSGFLLHAAPPAWWSQRGATTTASPADDFSAANIGQLKHMAARAAAEMNDTLPGGAGTPINTLVQSWAQPPAPGVTRDDFAALTVGQLKSVARLFQARLIATQYRATYPAWLQGPASTDTELANLGQIKTAFAFDLSAAAGQLPDWWQRYYFNGQVGISPSADTDGDGLTNLSEYILSTNPSVADLDGDHDGLPDELELEFGTDPGNPSSGGSGLPDGWLVENGFDALTTTADSDTDEGQGDGLSLQEEFASGTDPTRRDTDNDGVLDGPDGYAVTPFLSPPRVPESRYAVISLSSLGLPTDAAAKFLDRDGNIYYSHSVGSGYNVQFFLRCLSPGSQTTETIVDGHGMDTNEILISFDPVVSDTGWVAGVRSTRDMRPFGPHTSEVFRWKKGGTLEFMEHVPEFVHAGGKRWFHGFPVAVNDHGTVSAFAQCSSSLVIHGEGSDGSTTYYQESSGSSYALRWEVGTPAGQRIGEASYQTYIYTSGFGYDPSEWWTNFNFGNVFRPLAISTSPERIFGQRVRTTGPVSWETITTGALYSEGNITSLAALDPERFSVKAASDGKLITFSKVSPARQYFAQEDMTWQEKPLNVWDPVNKVKMNDFSARSLNDRREMVTPQGAIVRNGVLSPLSRFLVPTATEVGAPVTINSHGVILTDEKVLVPVEVAPEWLKVNSDFDEQKIDDTTGYAKPDNGDENLKAERGDNHNKIVTEDLHKGFFGVNPSTLPPDFYTGATVTITKKVEEDEDTGRPETGTVRLYAIKDLGASGEQSAAIPISTGEKPTISSDGPANLAATLYGASSTIPKGEGVTYWIEGVDPGPITLEFKYVKGDLTFSHEQKFKVVTRQTKQQWQEEIRQQIILQTEVAGDKVDIETHHPGDGLVANVKPVKAIYAYYQQLYLQRENEFMWAGMARTASASMADANYAGQTGAFVGVQFDEVETALLLGQILIFDDLAWQHRAYAASGIGALQYAREDLSEDFNLNAWRSIDSGIATENQQSINAGNRLLLEREQTNVVLPAYAIIRGAVPEGLRLTIFNWFAENPMPGGPPIQNVVPNGDFTITADRWQWIDDASWGMLPIWNGTATSPLAPSFNSGQRKGLVERDLRDAARPYLNYAPDVP